MRCSVGKSCKGDEGGCFGRLAMWGMGYGEIANIVKDGEVVKAGVAVSDGFVKVLCVTSLCRLHHLYRLFWGRVSASAGDTGSIYMVQNNLFYIFVLPSILAFTFTHSINSNRPSMCSIIAVQLSTQSPQLIYS